MGSICSVVNVCEGVSISSSREVRPKLKLLLIGLDNAGKTSTVMHLLGRTGSMDEVVPTVGFSSVEMKQMNRFQVEVYDLGGGPKIRSIWKNYFALVHGIIYVIDSTNEERVPEVKANIEEVIQHDKISMKPILILINKQDVDGAMDESDIRKTVNIESLVNKYKCPTRIESCAASANCDPSNPNTKNDAGIHRGYSWIISYIIKNWADLSERVEKEEKEQVETERQVMRERYRRYHEKNDAQSEKVQEMNGDVGAKIEPVEEVNGDLVKNVEPVEEVNGDLVTNVEPVEEVVTKTEIEVQENVDSHVDPTESVKSTSSSSKRDSKKKKSLFKSNKVTPLIPPSDES